jgi:hypothetical protein
MASIQGTPSLENFSKKNFEIGEKVERPGQLLNKDVVFF